MIVIKHIEHEFIDAASKCGEERIMGPGTVIGFMAMNIEGTIRIVYSPGISDMDAITMVKEQISVVAKQIG